MGRPKNSPAAPAFGQPAKPANLSPSAAAEWDRLIGEIEASGLQITPAHRALISLAATLAADIKSPISKRGWLIHFHHQFSRARLGLPSAIAGHCSGGIFGMAR